MMLSSFLLLQSLAYHPDTRGQFLKGMCFSFSATDHLFCPLAISMLYHVTMLSLKFPCLCWLFAARFPNYFYPFMDIGVTEKPHERIRLAALGVIAHLLKVVHA